MSDSINRRDWLKSVSAAASVGAIAPLGMLANAEPALVDRSAPLAIATHYAPGDIVELYSTSDVFTPARGRTWMKFSFDFPEPAVVFGGHRFSFLVFTDENTYALDRARMQARGTGDAVELTCDGFVWAGGQEKAPGKLTATLNRVGNGIEWQ